MDKAVKNDRFELQLFHISSIIQLLIVYVEINKINKLIIR